MMRKLLHGLLLGAGFGLAFSVVVTVYFNLVLPQILNNQTKSPDMSGGSTATVVPSEDTGQGIKYSKRKFKLHKGATHERRIPVNGGILSIAVIDTPENMNRPSTFQAWVTEKNAYIVTTEGETPTVKEVPYPEQKAVDYAGDLVRDGAGFREENMTVHVNHTEIEKLKAGMPAKRDEVLNGRYRITTEGVVFLLPNEYGT